MNEMNIANCETCGNYVPTIVVDGDIYCAYEYAEYADIATIVGQFHCQTLPLEYKQQQEKEKKMIEANGYMEQGTIIIDVCDCVDGDEVELYISGDKAICLECDEAQELYN